MARNRTSQREREQACRDRTRMIHGVSRSPHWEYDHCVVPPMTSSATFRLDSAARGAQGFFEFAHTTGDEMTRVPIYIYDRLDEPTRGMLEDNLAVAEHGEMALCYSSGMAAISAALAVLTRAGEHIICHKVAYGCTYSLLTNWMPRYDIAVSFIDLCNRDELRAAIRPETRVIYFETPVNPDMTIIDIAAIRRVADEANRGREERDRIRVVVDNTFATPYCQRPLLLGADVVCHSLTKGIGGFGTDVGGAVVGPRALHDALMLYRKDWGGSLAPKSAWDTLVFGLPTLATRMVNYQKSAHRVARFLSEHPKVAEVRYPGLETFPQYELAKKQMRDERGHFAPGSMLYFVLREKDATGRNGERLMDWIAQNSYCITLAVSLGQIKSLIECPYSMTHSAMPEAERRARGMVPGGCRLSVGLEDYNDIIGDLKAALDAL